MSKEIEQKQRKESEKDQVDDNSVSKETEKDPSWPKEKGGPKGPEPTRYGDWESKGKCVDF